MIDSGAIATLAVAFSSKYLPHFFALSPVVQKLISVALIVVLDGGELSSGSASGANLQNLLTVIKFAALVGHLRA